MWEQLSFPFDLIVCYLHRWVKIRIFPSKRKVAYKYAILVRSVLHIYAVGLYKYAFCTFAVTSFFYLCAHPLLAVCTNQGVCVHKVSRPCAHGQESMCTCLFVFSLPTSMYCIHIQKSGHHEALSSDEIGKNW